MEALLGCLQACAPAAALATGVGLRRSGLFSAADGETAAKFACWITLPSLILQSFNGLALADVQLPVVLGALACTVLTAALSWLAFRARHPKERGLLAGAAAGGAALPLAAYPFAAALFGPAGLRVALLCGLANSLAVWVGGYLLFSTAGAAFPDKYAHEDGGTYRGEWLGMLKQGYGVYSYPSGARYEGEWRNNLKEGRGVYRFPKGGVYEGEWRGGRMEGVGVRTFASGRVSAGVWRDGKLEAEWDERQCALAVEGAGEAAAAARRVQVGGGAASDAARQLLADPASWAYAAAAVLALTGRQLTPTLGLVSGQLALAHGPLALAALGLTLELGPPVQQRQAGDVSAVLALRLLPPLLLAAAACGAALRLGWPAAQALRAIGPMLVCAVAPAAPQVLAYAHRFRLNENLAAAITRTASAAGLVLMPLLATAATVSAAAGSVLPFMIALLGVASAVAAAAAACQVQGGGRQVGGLQRQAKQRAQQAQQAQQERQKVRMTYAPDVAASKAAESAPGTAASSDTAASNGSSGSGDASRSSAASLMQQGGAAAAPTEPQQPGAGQKGGRRSAFTDVGSDQPPQPPVQPQALPSRLHSGSRLRVSAPWRPWLRQQQQRGRVGGRSAPFARLLAL